MNLEKALKESNVSLYKLSKDLGIAYSTAFRWKNGGKISPAHEKLLSMYFIKKT